MLHSDIRWDTDDFVEALRRAMSGDAAFDVDQDDDEDEEYERDLMGADVDRDIARFFDESRAEANAGPFVDHEGAQLDMDGAQDDDEEVMDDVPMDPAAMADYMLRMDQELQQTSIGRSFSASEDQSSANADVSEFLTEDHVPKQLDIDMNLVTNLLAAHQAEHGMPGPTFSMLAALGINLPPPKQGDD